MALLVKSGGVTPVSWPNSPTGLWPSWTPNHPHTLIGFITVSSPPVAGVWGVFWSTMAAVTSSRWMPHTGAGRGDSPLLCKHYENPEKRYINLRNYYYYYYYYYYMQDKKSCSVRKGLIFLMLCSANLQDRAVFAMCSLKVSWLSKITPRFLTEADEVVKSCCRVGVAGKTRSSVFARLSYKWWSFIHAETATLGLCSLSSALLLSAIHQFLASQCFTFMNRLVLTANVCDE